MDPHADCATDETSSEDIDVLEDIEDDAMMVSGRSPLDGLAAFLDSAPSPYHVAEAAAARLEAEGFRRHAEDEPWDAGPGGHVLVRGGAVLAWWVPRAATQPGARPGFKILGSHTDSPSLMLKPTPDSAAAGVRLAEVEVYGSPILATWLDRDLGFAGRVIDDAGRTHLVATGPVGRIPSLAIHLDRERSQKLNPQTAVRPLLGVDGPELTEVLLRGIVEAMEPAGVEDGPMGAEDEPVGVEPVGAIVAGDLTAYDVQPATISGTAGEFFSAGRLDNLLSVHASLDALSAAVRARRSENDSPTTGEIAAPSEQDADILVLAAFHHEEVGSASPEGAGGPLLERLLRRTAQALHHDADEMMARSSCLSVDATHAQHPHYPDVHDPSDPPRLGEGPALKINAKQRYSTDAVGTALWTRACETAGVPSQVFVSRNDMPCGSTIGPVTATRLGITTVDVGIPILAMHSAREMAHVDDVQALTAALIGYLMTMRR